MLLVIGLLVLPAAGARLWVERWPAWVALSTVSGALCATLGAVWSRWAERTPTGPAVILCCGAFLFLGLILSPHRGVLAVQRRRSRLRRELRA
jgi:zinc/manganese transport system permease protein